MSYYNDTCLTNVQMNTCTDTTNLIVQPDTRIDDIENDVCSDTGIDVTENDVQSDTGIDVIENEVQSDTDIDVIENYVCLDTGIDVIENDVQSDTGIDVTENDVQSDTGIDVTENDFQSDTGIDVIENDVYTDTGIDVIGNNVQSDTEIDVKENDVPFNTPSNTDVLENGVCSDTYVQENDVQSDPGTDVIENDVPSNTDVIENDVQLDPGTDVIENDVPSNTDVIENDVQLDPGTDVIENDVQSDPGTDVIENDVPSNTDDTENDVPSNTDDTENDVPSNTDDTENDVRSSIYTGMPVNDVQSDNRTDLLGKDLQSDSKTLADPLGPVMTFDLLGPVGERLLCPTCICVSLTGEFVVSDTESCFVVIYSSDGQYLSHFSTIPKRMFYMFIDLAKYRPQDVAWLSSKRVVYTQPAGCRVVVSDWKGKSTVSIEGQPLYEPYGLCIDKSDKIYITDRAKGRILCYNSNGKLIKSLGAFGSREVLSNPHYIHVTNNGNICVNELCEGKIRVRVYSKTGTSSCVVGKGDNQVLGSLAVDPEGCVLQVDLRVSDLVVCPPPKLNGYIHKDKTVTEQNGHRDLTTSLLVSRTLTSDLGGMTFTNTDNLVCIDRKEKKAKVYVWNNHKEKLVPL
ncbi:uncharacterized protein LOC117330972 [Pecten maximus]|uniref:uncharacterized protein LOC117330972 n=1 Tax=Pecten maximus TaxID=6579 RepID=UPI0014580B47|nr:uncharacterized protein LOC117330972 [Pecten maximus]